MASASDITDVRNNTNVDETEVDDTTISDLVDASSVAGASAVIWTRKAAQYADLVDTAEAGSRESFSQLHKSALTMVAHFQNEREAELSPPATAPIVNTIIRTT